MSIPLSNPINRKMGPASRRPEVLHFPNVEKTQLNNGAQLYLIPGGTQEIVHLEIVFPAGKWHQAKPEVASATAHLLMDGTATQSRRKIAEFIDGIGGHLKTRSGTDQGKLLFSGLKKELEAALQLMREILTAPSFPEAELQKYLRRSVQELKMLETQREWLASRKFSEMLYGLEHPYGLSEDAEQIKMVTRNQVVDFYQSQYQMSQAIMYAAGRVDQKTVELINKYLGDILSESVGALNNPSFLILPQAEKKAFIEVEGASQCSIILGKRVPTLQQEDSAGLFVLNALLGGFFGSRLMQRLREEQGYTYNIYSMITDLEKDSYLYISTEVGAEVAEDSLKEIYKAIERLQEELMAPAELNLLINYLLGDLMVSMDGPFNQLRQLEDFISCGVKADYFDNFAATIRDMNAQQLQDLARKYLQPDSMYEVLAGKLPNINP